MTAGKQQYDKIIMGIDPGTNIMGYGLIGCFGKKFDLIAMGVIKLDKLNNHALKLKTIYERVHGLIENFNPDELAIEAPFFGKNVQSMLKLGRAQGVAIAAALNREIPIFEYSPKSIKKAITGKGTASKEQVAAMLKVLAKYDKDPKYFDATDGLATAVCHFFQLNPRSFGSMTTKKTTTKRSSWEGFVKSNPKRIK